MKNGLSDHAPAAAIAISGYTIDEIAKAINVPENDLEAQLTNYRDVLSPEEACRLKAFISSRSVLLIDSWLFDGAVLIKPLAELRIWLRLAEVFPHLKEDYFHWAYTPFARLWRAWLCLIGRSDRIRWPSWHASDSRNDSEAASHGE